MNVRKVENPVLSFFWQYGTAISVPLALAISSLVFIILGENPLAIYSSIAIGSIGSPYGISETLIETMPLLLISLGLCIAYRAKYWNIGAEGQYVMGAIVATPLALSLGSAPAFVAVPVLLVASAIGGGMYGVIAGALKAKLGVNEIITTLMMNFIAIEFLSYLTWGPLMGSIGKAGSAKSGQPLSDPMPASTQLPRLFNAVDLRVHIGIILALVLAIVVYVFLVRTSWGYQIRVLGSNPDAARYAGMNNEKLTLVVSFLSGAFAGIAGASVLLGTAHRLAEQFATGYGYTAIMVTLLGRTSPVGMIFASIFVAALSTGANFMYRTIGLPIFIVDVIVGLILLVMLGIDAASRLKRG
jgi:ABC-type uncharacterized transport system permease subunit